ncbi:hypothetical protein DMB66_42105 [Actinoplanes sp. ATCC 53533]|uniref:discoidin domain-containing protein n=1 Tax=Actinoplanes sp. ATCC 53533 TaxID=1288362 RepID=UPI000F79ABDE|nr:discoidin domain-containing protein [Actinoplanes sp. ATCC 53533]RSM51365.1 hypothetical protein DMB66_42105 [Actinoplanes sp. ATCC 53533]
MANPEERTDDRPELPTRVPFAGPHPGTVERDWRAPVSHTESSSGVSGQRSRTSLPRAVGVPRQRSILGGGSGPAPSVAERAGSGAAAAGTSPGSPVPGAESGRSKPAATAAPAEQVAAAEPKSPAIAAGAGQPLRSRVLPVAVAASILVAGGLWWSQDPAAPSAPQLAPAPTAAPTMRITAPGADASAGVGSDTAATKSASDAGATSTGGPASSGGSPAAASPAKSVKPSPNGAGAAVNTSGRNLALGARATASSIEGGHWAVANAVDGDLATRWSSQFSDPQWLMVDLGKRWEVSEILLHWENAHATAYRVEISTDGKKWKQVYSTTQGQGGDVTVQVPKTPTQLVRMSGTKRSTDYGYSLLDVEVR